MTSEQIVRQIIGAGFNFDSIVIKGNRYNMVDGSPVFAGYGNQADQVVYENIYDFLKSSGGIAGYVVDKLVKSGFDTVERLQDASDEDLLAIPGIGPKYVEIIRRVLDA